MKQYVINSFITKENTTKRANFNISTDKIIESDIKFLILDKLKFSDDWIFDSDKYELIESESVIIYKLFLLPNPDKKSGLEKAREARKSKQNEKQN